MLFTIAVACPGRSRLHGLERIVPRGRPCIAASLRYAHLAPPRHNFSWSSQAPLRRRVFSTRAESSQQDGGVPEPTTAAPASAAPNNTSQWIKPLLGAAIGIASALALQKPALAAAFSAGPASGGPPMVASLATIALQVLSFLVASQVAAAVRKRVGAACKAAGDKFKAQWKGALFIPVAAAIVGWVTNWIAVQMIFYPINYWGIPIKQWVLGTVYGCDVLSPLGAIGWQGIVPAKAARMAMEMVTMVTEKLINVQEVFYRLSPQTMAELLAPQVPPLALGVGTDLLGSQGYFPVSFAEDRLRAGALPGHLAATVADLQTKYIEGFTRALQANINRVLDLKELVVTSMHADKRLIVEIFQKCGAKELSFLVDSGLFFGFLLGIIQMGVWMFYDSPWTLTAGGAVVGYITNWLALKCIFEPVEPTRFGPFVIQGMFLKRQKEVSAEFADFFVDKVLTSQRMWETMLNGIKRGDFRALFREYTCGEFAPAAAAQLAGESPLLHLGPGELALAAAACGEACDRAADRLLDHVGPAHGYIDSALRLRETIKAKLELMTPQEFERVLHPIFEEDEMTLILAGGVLGAVAGYIQQITTVPSESQQKEQEERQAARQRLKDAGGAGIKGEGGGGGTAPA